MALELNESSFDAEVLQAKEPVLVDFWAPWCGPCRSMAPVIEELSREYTGKAKLAKVNVDENQSLAARYKIMSIPTIIIFKDGMAKDQIVGSTNKGVLARKLDQLLT
ncbi:MAG TPA: thioredoxin [Desulfotomaculum sp.]|jgi:thioredoxin 1|nr:thioredoxin [Desulfotomaculum sp.]